jgi:hypothetical protein
MGEGKTVIFWMLIKLHSHFITCWRWNRHSVPKRRLLILRRRGNTQKTIFQNYIYLHTVRQCGWHFESNRRLGNSVYCAAECTIRSVVARFNMNIGRLYYYLKFKDENQSQLYCYCSDRGAQARSPLLRTCRDLVGGPTGATNCNDLGSTTTWGHERYRRRCKTARL